MLVLVSRIDGEGKGNALSIHKQTHFNNGKRTVFLALSELFVILSLFYLKIEVSAVIINNSCFPFRALQCIIDK